MPKIHTHLSLALKLSKRIHINDLNAFLLGNTYPDIWDENIDDALHLHYKKDADSECDLTSFLVDNNLNDEFHLGYYFHLWVDNQIKYIDLLNISKYDCMICDYEMISPFISTLQANHDKEKLALNNIYKLSNEPMPLYLVHHNKKQQYLDILDTLVDQFIEHLKKIGVNL